MAKNLDHYLALPYRMDLRFDPESHAWIVRYPELPGCTADGKTPVKAMKAGEEAKELWLETALDEHHAIPEPQNEPTHSGKLVLRLPKTLHAAAVESADRECASLNTYLVQLVSEGVERSGMKNLIEHLETKLQQSFRVPGHEVVVVVGIKPLNKSPEIPEINTPESKPVPREEVGKDGRE